MKRQTHRRPRLSPDEQRAIGVQRALKGRSGPIVQQGGGIVKIDRYRYDYRDVDQDITIVGGCRPTTEDAGGRSAGKRPCFMVLLYPEEKLGVIQSIERGRDCSLDYDAPTAATVKAAIEVAKLKGMTRIELTDNSMSRTRSGKRFRLSEAYFLCKGTSWYQSIHPALEPEESMRPILAEWRAQLQGLQWGSFWTCIQGKAPGYPTPAIDLQTPVMTAFQGLRDTDFFADLGPYLPLCCGIGAIHGITWGGPI